MFHSGYYQMNGGYRQHPTAPAQQVPTSPATFWGQLGQTASQLAGGVLSGLGGAPAAGVGQVMQYGPYTGLGPYGGVMLGDPAQVTSERLYALEREITRIERQYPGMKPRDIAVQLTILYAEYRALMQAAGHNPGHYIGHHDGHSGYYGCYPASYF